MPGAAAKAMTGALFIIAAKDEKTMIELFELLNEIRVEGLRFQNRSHQNFQKKVKTFPNNITQMFCKIQPKLLIKNPQKKFIKNP